MFKEVDPKPDFPKIERKILDFWEKNKCFEKLVKKNKNKKPWSFYDGPITANNPMGVHHAWGRTLKDLNQRFRAMQGYDQRFQNGFDCQGLWVEVGVEKELGFNSKKEILDFGLANFSKACRKRVEKYSAIQTQQSIRLGQWMDWKNSYYTMSDTNIEYIWYFLQKCHQKGWLYKDTQVMPWCTRCGTSLSQHELADGYEETVHDAIYIKFPLKNKKDEYFLVWTTTPWTLTSNVALAVHPNLIYAKIKLGEEVYYLAKDLIGILGNEVKILDEFLGKKLEDIGYEGPFDELPVQRNINHKVVLWEEVSKEEGTGIVHIAPGCGAEDNILGKKFGLKEIAPLDENGMYIEEFGWLTGEDVHTVKDKIIKDLERKNILFKKEKYRHRYPFCWRCKNELVFRLVEEWFIKADEIRESMKKQAFKVKWMPESVGKRMLDWLNNMGDWCISRKRFWGLPLPFYKCGCGNIKVVGSKEELKKLALEPKKVDNLPELHRPWIDEIKIKCPKCGKEAQRIPEVGDCWLDAGIIPFSTLGYLEDKIYWKKWFPADFICEMREQVRLWFYSMLFMAVTLENKTPYKSVLAYEKVFDEKGRPMHKSSGNVIWFDEAVEKMGADVMRWIYISQNPSFNLNFGYNLANEIKRKILTLWNTYSFFVIYANIDKWQPSNESLVINKRSNLLDKWIISRLNILINEVTHSLEGLKHIYAIVAFENFIDDLSNWYVRRSRRRFWKSEDDKDKKQAYQTLYNCLVTVLKLLAPFIPFLTEEIYQNLIQRTEKIKNQAESIHLCDWPKADNKLIDKKLNEEMDLYRNIATLTLACRAKAKIKVRQPLSEVIYWTSKTNWKPEGFLDDLVKEELNVKSVINVDKKKILEILPKGSEIYKQVKEFNEIKESLEFSEENLEGKAVPRLVVVLNKKLTKELKQEGYIREIVRHIQEMRKKAGYQVNDRIYIGYQLVEAPYLKEAFKNFKGYIKQETLAEQIKEKLAKNVDLSKEIEVDKQKVLIGIKKIE